MRGSAVVMLDTILIKVIIWEAKVKKDLWILWEYEKYSSRRDEDGGVVGNSLDDDTDDERYSAGEK